MAHVPIDASAHWSAELGGRTSIRLIQAGVFTSDAGTVFGPVPRVMWDRLVADEINPDHTLTQALNCLYVETPAGHVLVETGIGERMDERHRAQRGVRGQPILPSLEVAGVEAGSIDYVALSHLHFDHAGGLLSAAGEPAFPRARIVAQAKEWEFSMGTNPRLTASYEQAELRLSEAAIAAGSVDGDEELIPGVSVRLTGGHSGGHQAVVIRGRDETVAFIGDLFMRAWQANPRWIPSFDDFPLTSVEVKASLFAEAAAEGWTIVLSHEPRRPVGRLVEERGRYRFEPII